MPRFCKEAFNRDVVEDIIQYSFRRLINESWDMVQRNTFEDSINNEFVYYMREKLIELGFSHQFVNGFYDRQGDEIKCGIVDGIMIDDFIPDILIHRRGVKRDNILVIEAKKEWHNEKDKQIVHALIHKAPHMEHCCQNYKFGCFISYNHKKYCIVDNSNFIWTDSLRGRFTEIV